MDSKRIGRREFMVSATAFASFARPITAEPVKIQLTHQGSDWPVMAADFIGLSYEAGQLYNAEFFSAHNQPLINAFRRLNPRGVLRLGGHLSNITPWEGVGLDDPKQIRGVRHGIEDYWEWPLVDPSVQQNKHGMLARATLRNLRGFLDAVDWRLIYGLNFACGSAARAADEAAAVSSIMGNRLIAFVIGNEPDGFGEDPFFRQKAYSVQDYLSEYEAWVKTIRTRVPRAQFAGPDTDGKVDSWVLEFAKHTRGDAILLTSHYYGMGPASDPAMTAERLLRKNPPALDAQITAVDAARRAAGGTPYRMDEGNSCFGGGRKGVSDAYASALWAADYILKVACAGFAGVNFHGGGVGVYTPIETSTNAPAVPRPVYFGMEFAQRFTGCAIAPCTLETSENISGYQANNGNARMLALINKGDLAVQVALPEKFSHAERLARWELRGPSLDAKTGVTFGPVQSNRREPAAEIAGYSAMILQAD